ncbi:phosphotransferase [Microbacterium sp. A93]|uniref:phosphotransferase n=1 Tax=Microbacterium sp. A93 TaxID=3450716 RepID=UPI003F43F45E
MHVGQLDVDEGLVGRLIDEQFPAHRGMPVRRVATLGTVNAIFRVGVRFVARLPLEAVSASELETEAQQLGAFAAASPFAAPEPIGVGTTSAEYPSAWSIQTWVPGDVASPSGHAASEDLADDVVTLIAALRAVSVGGRTFDGNGRGGNLRDHDEWLMLCLARSTGLLDVETAAHLWNSLHALPSLGADVMSHRDLTPPNLLVSNGRLSGVLDGGAFGPADPALDLVAAWHLFDADSRERVRRGLGVSDVEWLRGAAWAFQQAMGLGWYYVNSNPAMSALGLSTIERLLNDDEVRAFAG